MEKKTKMMVFCLLLSVICSPVLTGEWKAEVVQKLDALVSSCIVIPCTFTYPENNLPRSKLRGIWHLKSDQNQRVYHEDNTRVLENFRGRTKLLGNLGQNNCTLEITEIKDHDNGPYCFRIELAETDEPTKKKFSFVEDCAALNMLSDPLPPELIYSETAFLGTPYTITCKVFHTCPSHSPALKWSRGENFMEHHRKLPYGLWEVESIITLIPEEKDDHEEVTCTATFNGQRTSSNKFKLRVKRALNYNHIIIPVVVALGTAVTFGVLCVFMVKRYKRRIAELQSQDGSMWNRLSRLSRRFHSGGRAPFNSDQRRSIWSRFSRRPRGDMGDSGPMPNNSKPCDNKKISKPRFPSPKSQPKVCNYKEDLDDGDDYENTADLNVYGNI